MFVTKRNRENEKPRGCDINGKRMKGIGLSILICLVFAVLVTPVQAAMKPVWFYKENQCELIAKDFCKSWKGGSCSYVWLQPLKKNGAFDLGEFKGHLISKAYSKETGTFYIDYKTQAIFYTEEEVLEWYSWYAGLPAGRAKLYDLSRGRPPFNINWKY